MTFKFRLNDVFVDVICYVENGQEQTRDQPYLPTQVEVSDVIVTDTIFSIHTIIPELVLMNMEAYIAEELDNGRGRGLCESTSHICFDTSMGEL